MLIKSSVVAFGEDLVRPYSATAQDSSQPEPSRESLIEVQLSSLEAELRELRESIPRQLDQAREEGARDALDQRSDAEAKSLEAVRSVLDKARKHWSDRLVAWDSAAIGVARSVLEQVFAKDDDRAALIDRAIAAKIGQLDAAAIVRVRVSADDFRDGGSVASANGVEVAIDERLASGDCVIDLKLGHIDLGLGAQWQRIAALLDELEHEGLNA